MGDCCHQDKAYEIDKEALNVLMEKEAVCWGEGSRLARDPDGKSYMTVLLGKNQENGIKEGGEKCVIYTDEADTDSDNPYLMSLMGRRIPSIIMGIDEESNRLRCSRKKAQDLLKAAMLQGLASGKVYEGELVSFSRHGGYIEVNKRSSGVFVNLQLGIDARAPCPGSWRSRRVPASPSRSSPLLRIRMPPRPPR